MFEEISPTSNLPAAKHDRQGHFNFELIPESRWGRLITYLGLLFRNDNVLERQGSDDLFFDAEEASEV